MAVTQVIEYKGESERQLKQDGPYLVPADVNTRYFQVVVDDPATAHSEIYAHADIPKRFEPHPDNDGVIVKKIKLNQGDDDESYVFDVTVEYNDEYSGEDPEEPEDGNPLSRPISIQGSFNEREEILFRDIDGTKIRNSAEDPFDPPVTRKAGAFRFSISKNFASLSLPLLRQYKNAINSDTWKGFAPETVRIANITFERRVEPWKVDEDTTVKVVFWPHTFEFEVAEEEFGSDGTWRKYVLDQGFGYWTVDEAMEDVFQPFLDTTGAPVSTPKPLDGAGGIGVPGTDVWLPFNIYRQLPFSALGLD